MKFEKLQQYTFPAKIPWTSRKIKIVTILGGILCLRFLFGPFAGVLVSPAQSRVPYALRQEARLDGGLSRTLPISGFVNTGELESRACEDLRHEGELQVQNSRHISDDLEQIARSLAHHPMIDYRGKDMGLTFHELVAKSWARLSGSSVWIEKFQVFLTVTRVIFYSGSVRNKPVISFLAGQLHDKNWNELKNYTIQWQSEEIRFPTVFNIPAPYKAGELYFGPEDPRVIIEEGVEDAEPIVIFNMMYDLKTSNRAMHLFRPFSNDTTVLSITGQVERPSAEKNWAPFFLNEHQLIAPGRYQWPSHYIHFIYDFNPLRVLKCHKLNGWCNFIYEQEVPDDLRGPRITIDGRMTGGTNLVSLRLDSNPDVHAWIGFPRSHINTGCRSDLAMYRPELTVMTTHGSTFYLNYMSTPIDFSTSALTPEAIHDPCGEGKIVIANSIAKWDTTAKQDLLTLTISVADSTVQILELVGLSKFIEQLPCPHDPFLSTNSSHNKTDTDMRYNAIGEDVLQCSMEAAVYYSEIVAAPYRGFAKGELYYDAAARAASGW